MFQTFPIWQRRSFRLAIKSWQGFFRVIQSELQNVSSCVHEASNLRLPRAPPLNPPLPPRGTPPSTNLPTRLRDLDLDLPRITTSPPKLFLLSLDLLRLLLLPLTKGGAPLPPLPLPRRSESLSRMLPGRAGAGMTLAYLSDRRRPRLRDLLRLRLCNVTGTVRK